MKGKVAPEEDVRTKSLTAKGDMFQPTGAVSSERPRVKRKNISKNRGDCYRIKRPLGGKLRGRKDLTPPFLLAFHFHVEPYAVVDPPKF